MNDKFRNKYRSNSARLQTWNYGWDAAYFITICTKDRGFYFGNVVGGEMQLSPAGVIANDLWYEIKNHAKNVELGEFVVMPNHIHGIIILDDNNPIDKPQTDIVGKSDNGGTAGIGGIGGTGTNVGTRHALSLPSPEPSDQSPEPSDQSPEPFDHPPIEKTIGQQRFQNQGKNTISSIVGSYKSAVTKHCNRLELDFAWQSRFHDHIIRDGKSFERISEYIKNNPLNWKRDKFHE